MKPLITQFGVLPYRIDPDKGVQFLLVTSREHRPLGDSEGQSDAAAARPRNRRRAKPMRRPAIEGEGRDEPIGAYRYDKQAALGQSGPRRVVTVYPLLGDPPALRLAGARRSANAAGSIRRKAAPRSTSPSSRR